MVLVAVAEHQRVDRTDTVDFGQQPRRRALAEVAQQPLTRHPAPDAGRALDALGGGEQPLELARHLIARLFGKTGGAVFGRWDEARGEGVWFHSPDTTAIFESPAVEEVIFRETVRSRFRSVVFRLGSLAAETEGDLCGVVRLVPEDPSADAGPPRRYIIHASFDPAAGLWFKAAIVADAEDTAPRNTAAEVRG